MKSSVIAFTLICAALIGITAAAPEAVLDTTGKKLRVGSKYFIVPVIRNGGGGLTLEPRANTKCPLFVVQDVSETSNGQAVTFSPSAPNKDGVVLTSTDLNIKSAVASTGCEPPSPVWRLLKEISEALFVSTGGVEGKPGSDTIFNWFKIEKDGRDYHLSFCPSVSETVTVCDALGIYVDSDGTKYLALGNDLPPLKVMFRRAFKEEEAFASQ